MKGDTGWEKAAGAYRQMHQAIARSAAAVAALLFRGGGSAASSARASLPCSAVFFEQLRPIVSLIGDDAGLAELGSETGYSRARVDGDSPRALPVLKPPKLASDLPLRPALASAFSELDPVHVPVEEERAEPPPPLAAYAGASARLSCMRRLSSAGSMMCLPILEFVSWSGTCRPGFDALLGDVGETQVAQCRPPCTLVSPAEIIEALVNETEADEGLRDGVEVQVCIDGVRAGARCAVSLEKERLCPTKRLTFPVPVTAALFVPLSADFALACSLEPAPVAAAVAGLVWASAAPTSGTGEPKS